MELTLEILKKLKSEFPKDQITFRPGNLTKDKTKALPLAYIDARDVMDRLDEVVGCENWKDEYEFHGARTMCKLSIRFDGEWITKCDGAGDTDFQGEKGGLSDAFKRAAVKWGIGRYLYDLSFAFMPIDQYKRFTKDPWTSQLKNREVVSDSTLEEPKPKVEPKPKTDAEKLIAATKFTNGIIDQLNKATTQEEIDKIMKSNNKTISALYERYEDLADKINNTMSERMSEIQ